MLHRVIRFYIKLPSSVKRLVFLETNSCVWEHPLRPMPVKLRAHVPTLSSARNCMVCFRKRMNPLSGWNSFVTIAVFEMKTLAGYIRKLVS